MSTEAYVPPTLIQPPGGATSGGAGAGSAVAGLGEGSKPVRYVCGECNAKVYLRRQDVVRCGECGHRVLYKERTTRMVQFEAR